MDPYSALANRLAEQAQRAIRPLQEWLDRHRDEYEQFTESVLRSAAHFRESWSKEARESYPALVQHGWYPDIEMSGRELGDLVAMLSSKNARKADREFCEYFESALGQISKRFREWYPERRHVLTNGFWAHRRHRYYLSVPVLLAQADGICADLLGEQLFRRKKKRPAVAAIVEKGDPFWSALLVPLTLSGPISASSQEEQNDDLNRHAVLHGKSLSYGTRVNSCKAISLLNYTGTFLHFWRGLS